MKVIIAGGRDFDNYDFVLDAILESGFDIKTIISGGAKGVDDIAKEISLEAGISYEEFPADWGAYGKAAGPIRNRLMAEYADALIAIWDGNSSGTKNMIDEAQKRALKIFIKKY